MNDKYHDRPMIDHVASALEVPWKVAAGPLVDDASDAWWSLTNEIEGMRSLLIRIGHVHDAELLDDLSMLWQIALDRAVKG